MNDCLTRSTRADVWKRNKTFSGFCPKYTFTGNRPFFILNKDDITTTQLVCNLEISKERQCIAFNMTAKNRKHTYIYNSRPKEGNVIKGQKKKGK